METSTLAYRIAGLDALPNVAAFVQGVYAAAVAPMESAAGQATFARYTDPMAMAASAATHVVWVAELSGAVVGTLEVRGGTHVALLFVAPAYQRQGVGRGLLSAAFGMPEYWPELTVNSTPGAMCAYARLGFRPVGPEEEQNGLRFQAMRRPAREESFGSSAPAGKLALELTKRANLPLVRQAPPSRAPQLALRASYHLRRIQ